MISYETIFSRFLSLIADYNLSLLSDSDVEQLETEWLHIACSEPRIRQKFSAFSLDDMMGEVSYSLVHSVDEYADNEYVVRLLSLGMAIAWLQQQVDSVLHTAPFIGGDKEKKVLDNHASMIGRLDTMKTELRKTLRDYGYYNNAYVRGEL